MAPTIITTEPVALDGLTEHPENDRVGNVDRVARSLLTNNQYRPLVVQQGTGLVLAGNHVRRAAAMLAAGDLPPLPDGYDDPDDENYSPALVAGVERFQAEGFPTDVVATLVACTDDEARAILVADNHTGDDSTYDEQASLDLALKLAEAGMLGAATWDTDHLDDLRAALDEAAAEAAPTGVGFPSSKQTNDERLANYEQSGTRSVVLFLGAEDYTTMVERLAQLRKTFGVESNTEVVMRLVADAVAGAEPPEVAQA